MPRTMPENFLSQLYFLTIKEAQRLIDVKYPGWYIRMFADEVAKIYNPQNQCKWTISNGKRYKR